MIRAKILFQELWLLKIDWDEEIPIETCRKWLIFRQELQNLQNLSIPRWLGSVSTNNFIEIHGFSDASNLVMAAAVYLRDKVRDEEFMTRLVCAKTRVALLKRLTIPCFELTAALILSHLVKYVLQTLNFDQARIYLRTDSYVALTWISSRWKNFLRNWVTQIQEAVPSGLWRFISGKDNSADCASRSLQPNQLVQHSL